MRIMGKDCLSIRLFDTRNELGLTAAADVSAKIRKLLEQKETIRMVFAAAPSQSEFLQALSADASIDFSRITAFHMDEYIGLDPDAPQGFGNFLKEHIFSRAPFQKVHYLNGQARDIAGECERYAALLSEAPLDIICMGIGENAHIAFNDPGEARFDDPLLVKEVQLDITCRQQQVNDGCFAKLSDVPTRAMTLTIPALTREGAIFCMVPASTKANAVYSILSGEVEEAYPASILRTCPGAILYVDSQSGARLGEIPSLEQTEV